MVSNVWSSSSAWPNIHNIHGQLKKKVVVAATVVVAVVVVVVKVVVEGACATRQQDNKMMIDDGRRLVTHMWASGRSILGTSVGMGCMRLSLNVQSDAY
jgi:hypothetical protein